MDDDGRTFAAGEKVRGQAESRASYSAFLAWADGGGEGGVAGAGAFAAAWRVMMNDPQRPKWLDWRKAAYVAWRSLPADKRKPATQAELAALLGLRSDEVMRTWRKRWPELDQMVRAFTVGLIERELAAIVQALVTVASDPTPAAHSDRKLALEMAGVYNPKGGPQAVAVAGVGVDKLAEALGRAYGEPAAEGGEDVG